MSKSAKSAKFEIVVALFDGVVPLDFTGPAGVFSEANAQLGELYYGLNYLLPPGKSYVKAVDMLELGGVGAQSLPDQVHMLLVPGAEIEPLQTVMHNKVYMRQLAELVSRSTYVASVCSGAFLLGELGVLDGHRATTHWAGVERLAERYADAQVMGDALYIQDGRLWTAAGVLSGVDMALQMLKNDHGHALALQVAKRLVAYLVRPGGQSQFSVVLETQSNGAGEHSEHLIAWVSERLNQSISVGMLADQFAMSERSIHRLCNEEFGMSPAKLIRKLRLDLVKQKLSSTKAPLKRVASDCGFSSPLVLSKTFKKAFGVSPIAYRQQFN